MTSPLQIAALHRVYRELTGLEIRLDMERERVWFEWTRAGFGEADLRTVVHYLRRGIRENWRRPGALKFTNLIGQPDKFEEDLAEAKQFANGKARQAKPDAARASVLAATGRPDPGAEYAVRNGGEAAAKALADLKKAIR